MKFETALTAHGEMLFYTTEEKIEKYKREFETRTWEEAVGVAVMQSQFDLFIDIGAGFGYYSLMARLKAKEILAFEPHPLRYGILSWNLRDVAKATAIEASVGGQSYTNLSNPTDMATVFGGTNVLPTKADVVQLVDYVIGRDDERILIKIDVEGMELDVIRSLGVATEHYDNIVWIVEYHDNWRHMKVSADDVQYYFPKHSCYELGHRSHLMFVLEGLGW